MERGSAVRNSAIRSGSKARVGGNCQSTGPSLSARLSNPLARKFGSAAPTSRSRFMWVMNRPPLTANWNPSGVSAAHR